MYSAINKMDMGHLGYYGCMSFRGVTNSVIKHKTRRKVVEQIYC